MIHISGSLSFESARLCGRFCKMAKRVGSMFESDFKCVLQGVVLYSLVKKPAKAMNFLYQHEDGRL